MHTILPFPLTFTHTSLHNFITIQHTYSPLKGQLSDVRVDRVAIAITPLFYIRALSTILFHPSPLLVFLSPFVVAFYLV